MKIHESFFTTRVMRQSRIYRADLKANPSALYIFSDERQRVGMSGQAGEMRGELNAVGVATKYAPGDSESDFYNDTHMHAHRRQVVIDLTRVYERLSLWDTGQIVVPADGIGTGLAELTTRAPELNKWIEYRLNNLGTDVEFMSRGYPTTKSFRENFYQEYAMWCHHVVKLEW